MRCPSCHNPHAYIIRGGIGQPTTCDRCGSFGVPRGGDASQSKHLQRLNEKVSKQLPKGAKYIPPKNDSTLGGVFMERP